MRGLYPIVDLGSLDERGFDALVFGERVLRARPALLQLRAKHAAPRRILSLLRALAPLCRARGTLLFANDRPDLALLAGADGVHVGQDDLPPSAVRRFARGLRLGVSTHDFEQLERALELAPDYVAFGPIFPTRSKANPDPVVGLAGLERAAELARARGVPLVAIGGIDQERAPLVARTCAAAAVIGALLPGALDEVEARARSLARALGGA